MQAVYVETGSGQPLPLDEHICQTLARIAPYAVQYGATPALQMLHNDVSTSHNDARWLRERQAREQLLGEVTRQASRRFRGEAL